MLSVKTPHVAHSFTHVLLAGEGEETAAERASEIVAARFSFVWSPTANMYCMRVFPRFFARWGTYRWLLSGVLTLVGIVHVMYCILVSLAGESEETAAERAREVVAACEDVHCSVSKLFDGIDMPASSVWLWPRS
jgi:hypothetical protein